MDYGCTGSCDQSLSKKKQMLIPSGEKYFHIDFNLFLKDFNPIYCAVHSYNDKSHKESRPPEQKLAKIATTTNLHRM